ncbi:unnamed protein product [Urochloa decumbens]|uniref:Uncharacterized protein n=1 Tax=Urochloa decumbens TaxID=240449 RepID=A0ABC8Z3B7_9POAL
MAAEAQAESPGPVPPPPPPPARGTSSSASPEKRALLAPGDDDRSSSGEEEGEERRQLPEPKRRRASVAALDSVPPSAPAAEAEGAGSGGDADGGASFSFQHARGGFAAPETTPKFGSFNPPGEDGEMAGLDLKPAEPGAGGEGSLEADGEVPSASARGAEVKDEDGQLLVDGEVDG